MQRRGVTSSGPDKGHQIGAPTNEKMQQGEQITKLPTHQLIAQRARGESQSEWILRGKPIPDNITTRSKSNVTAWEKDQGRPLTDKAPMRMVLQLFSRRCREICDQCDMGNFGGPRQGEQQKRSPHHERTKHAELKQPQPPLKKSTKNTIGDTGHKVP